MNNSSLPRLVKSLLWATLLLPLAGHAQNLVVNGDFQTGDMTGWNGTGANIAYNFLGVFNDSADFYHPLSLAYIDQVLTTTPGATYNLSFDLSSDGQTPNEFQVRWGGTMIWDQTNIPRTGGADQTFFPVTLNGLTASTVATDLVFGGRNDPGGLVLDNVSVSAVPEPATYAALLGTAALCFVGLRRRRAA
jgi:hypothetical protein